MLYKNSNLYFFLFVTFNLGLALEKLCQNMLFRYRHESVFYPKNLKKNSQIFTYLTPST